MVAMMVLILMAIHTTAFAYEEQRSTLKDGTTIVRGAGTVQEIMVKLEELMEEDVDNKIKSIWARFNPDEKMFSHFSVSIAEKTQKKLLVVVESQTTIQEFDKHEKRLKEEGWNITKTPIQRIGERASNEILINMRRTMKY